MIFIFAVYLRMEQVQHTLFTSFQMARSINVTLVYASEIKCNDMYYLVHLVTIYIYISISIYAFIKPSMDTPQG